MANPSKPGETVADVRYREMWARKARTALAAAVVAAEAEDWYQVEAMIEHTQKQVDQLLWRTVKEPR
jgi:hypothetical protein